MLNYKIAHSTKNDLPFIFSLFDEAIEYQKRKQFPVWVGYDKEGLERDIENLISYKIMINNEIACIFTITLDDQVIWRERDQNNAVYVHRVVVNPNYKGQKQFGKVLKWLIDFAKERNLPFIRMDTWGNNPNIIDYYKSFGFEMVEFFKAPNTDELPIQQRGNLVALLEYSV